MLILQASNGAIDEDLSLHSVSNIRVGTEYINHEYK